jgi:aminoglycoside phosphotransferase (APT) family kinase protein
MVQAEYESTTALYAAVPDNVPRPHAYGCFAADPRRFWYLQSFCDMDDAPVDAGHPRGASNDSFADKFIGVLAQLHRKESPAGKFGFHVTST